MICCFQWFKDTNLKVNHNAILGVIGTLLLFPMVQRYKFESKSQHTEAEFFAFDSCFQWFKDTNLKVNHNRNPQRYCKSRVVSNGSKIQI